MEDLRAIRTWYLFECIYTRKGVTFLMKGGETFFHNKAKNKRRESNSEFVDNSLFRVGRREPLFFQP